MTQLTLTFTLSQCLPSSTWQFGTKHKIIYGGSADTALGQCVSEGGSATHHLQTPPQIKSVSYVPKPLFLAMLRVAGPAPGLAHSER